MPMLHTVNKSPYERNSLDSCLNHARDGSSVLLFEDGIYAVIKGGKAASGIQAAKGISFYAHDLACVLQVFHKLLRHKGPHLREMQSSDFLPSGG